MIKNSKKFFWAFVSGFLLFSSGHNVFASDSGTPTPVTIPNPLGANTTIISFITLLLDTIFPIASLVAVFFLIFAGFLMVTAGGNEEKLSKARQAFLWTVIGVAILLGAKVLSAVICGTINQLSTTHLSCPI